MVLRDFMDRVPKGLLVDIDGVLVKRGLVINKSIQAVDILKNHFSCRFLTNISNKSRAQISEELISHGFNIAENEIISAGYAIGRYIKDNCVKTDPAVLMFGESGLQYELEKFGIQVIDLEEGYNGEKIKIDYVVMGLNRNISYSKLCFTAEHIQNGAIPIAANIAKWRYAEKGFSIGPGFFVKGMEFITGVKAKIIGKPYSYMFQLAKQDMGFEDNHIMMIGDKIYEDIEGAKKNGFLTALVLSGFSKLSDLEGTVAIDKPDIILEDLFKLTSYL